MCEQCAGFDDHDDEDALAAAFLKRQAEAKAAAAAKPAQPHALFYRKAAAAPVAGKARE
jgi:hypothetical protein